jgi:glycosyltransferase involved in cell wall biosynthesis
MMRTEADPLVSVVVPAYRAEATLRHALDSIAAQRGAFVRQVVIVEDRSPDRTLDVALQLESENPGLVQVIRHERNRGAAAARNTGGRAAREPWIAFLDADDAWRDDKLALQFEAMRAARRTPDICTTDVLVVPMSGGRPYVHHNRARRGRTGVIRQLAESSISRLTPTILLRRSLFLDLGGFDESLLRMEDHEFLIRAVRAGTFLHVPLPLTVNRVFVESTRTRDADALSRQLDQFARTVAAVDPRLRSCRCVLSARIALGNALVSLKRRQPARAFAWFGRLAAQGPVAASKVVAEALRRRAARALEA